MINQILTRIWLLKELQYWIDNWQRFDTNDKRWKFSWVQDQLYHNGDQESVEVARKAKVMSLLYPVHELSERDIV